MGTGEGNFSSEGGRCWASPPLSASTHDSTNPPTERGHRAKMLRGSDRVTDSDSVSYVVLGAESEELHAIHSDPLWSETERKLPIKWRGEKLLPFAMKYDPFQLT